MDTYSRFAEAADRADLAESDGSKWPTELSGGGLTESAANAVAKKAVDGVKEALGFGDTRR